MRETIVRLLIAVQFALLAPRILYSLARSADNGPFGKVRAAVTVLLSKTK